MKDYDNEIESENKNKDSGKRNLLLTILGLIVITAILAGTTYAAFNVGITGSKINIIKTGQVTMSYVERNGINITDTAPLNDDGKKLYSADHTFNFNVGISVKGETTVNYEITAEKDDTVMTSALTSTCESVWGKENPTATEIASCPLIRDSEIRLYLVKKDAEATNSYTDSNGNLPNGVEQVLAPTAFVTGTSNTLGNSQYGGESDEMVLYRGTLSSSNNKTTDTHYFELRMWVNDNVYRIDGTERRYAIKVNVYGSK